MESRFTSVSWRQLRRGSDALTFLRRLWDILRMDKNRKLIERRLRESSALKLAAAKRCWREIGQAADAITESLKSGCKVLAFGNGGSASDAQHFVAELVNRFLLDRAPLPAIALNTDTSVLTCIGNDLSFDEVFSRQVSALGTKGDVAFAITTSGNSKNILNALKAARKKGMKSIGLLGRGGGKAKRLVDIPIVVPSDITPRIQETHIAIIHIICEIVEAEIFSAGRHANG
jgi:D-sedoheptulose 7-phosphate isomerase